MSPLWVLCLLLAHGITWIPHCSGRSTVPSCPRPDYQWRELLDRCVKLYTQKVDWDTARTTCSQDRGVLLRPEKYLDAQVVRWMFPHTIAWIGLNDKRQEGRWVWTNGDPATCTQCWDSPSPSTHQPDGGTLENCALVDKGYWYDYPCSHTASFLCQIDRSTYIDECASRTHNCSADATCKLNGASYTCTCLPGYYGDGHSCRASIPCAKPNYSWISQLKRCVRLYQVQASWTAASKTCTQENGQLIKITSIADVNAVKSFVASAIYTTSIWIGLQTSPEWKWTDGERINYTNWSSAPDGYSGENCVSASSSSGLWFDGSCRDQRSYMCELHNNECKTGAHNCAANANCAISNGSVTCTCSTGYTGNGTLCSVPCPRSDYVWRSQLKRCVKVYQGKTTWTAANKACTQDKGQLIRLESAADVNAVKSIVYSDIWIGLNDIHQEGNWKWTDGHRVTYTNWKPNRYYDDTFLEPNGGHNENCVVAASSSAFWSDHPCGAQESYVCELIQQIDECRTGTHNCPSNAQCTDTFRSFTCTCHRSDYKWSIGLKRCVKQYNTTLTWLQARDACIQDNSTLVRIESDHEVFALQALTNDECWIGLNDLQVEDEWQWTDGMKTNSMSGVRTSYTNWGFLEPLGHTSENCVLAGKSGKWEDHPCDSSLFSFVCELPIICRKVSKDNGYIPAGHVGQTVVEVCWSGSRNPTNIPYTCSKTPSNTGDWTGGSTCENIPDWCPRRNVPFGYIPSGSRSQSPKIVCDPGYEGENLTAWTCTYNRKWHSGSGACVANPSDDCPPLPRLTNGRFSNVNARAIGVINTAKCDPGYSTANDKLECVVHNDTDGTWEGNTPDCTVIQNFCGRMDTAAGYVLPGRIGQTTVEKCWSGARNAGSGHVTCLATPSNTGRWHGSLTCEYIPDWCPRKDVSNGHIQAGGRLSKNQIVCNQGYYGKNLTPWSCAYNRKWFGGSGSCVATNGGPTV